jgi:hypothetical protein
MAEFTALATKVYKDPVTVQWANSLKQNHDWHNERFKFVTFEATGTALAGALNIIDSRGVLTVNRDAQGEYTITFTGDYNHTGYAIGGCGQDDTNQALWPVLSTTGGAASAQCTVKLYEHGGIPRDADRCMIIILGTATV